MILGLIIGALIGAVVWWYAVKWFRRDLDKKAVVVPEKRMTGHDVINLLNQYLEASYASAMEVANEKNSTTLPANAELMRMPYPGTEGGMEILRMLHGKNTTTPANAAHRGPTGDSE